MRQWLHINRDSSNGVTLRALLWRAHWRGKKVGPSDSLCLFLKQQQKQQNAGFSLLSFSMLQELLKEAGICS